MAFTPALYVDMQLLDLEGDHERKIFLGVITPLVMGLCAVAQPLLVTPWLPRRALRSEGELRVQRLIRIPALLAFGETMVSWFVGGILAGLFSCPLMFMAFEKVMLPTVLDA